MVRAGRLWAQDRTRARAAFMGCAWSEPARAASSSSPVPGFITRDLFMVPWSLCAAVSLVPCKSYLMRREQGCPNAALRTHLRPAAFALLMTQTPGAKGHKTFCFWCSTGGRWEGSVSLLPWCWGSLFPSGAAVLGAVRFSPIVPWGTRQHRTLLALWSRSCHLLLPKHHSGES